MPTYLTANSEAYVADGGEIVYAFGGDDQIYVIPVNDSVGTDLDWDYLSNTEVHGGGGDDLLVGHNREIWIDILYGDSGNDTIHAGAGGDFSYGGTGDDVIWTSTGEDFVDAGGDDDTVYATEASNGDVLHGGIGYDILHLGHTANESFNFSLAGQGSTSGLVATGFEELHFVGGNGFENIEGSENADYMQGGGNTDLLSGLDGDDRLRGDDGADVLHGGNGNDDLDGGSDNDIIHGGSGSDGIDGGSGDDNLHGEDGSDVIRGGIGNDTIRDGTGSDTVHGDGGNDTIRTGAGNDEIFGDSGDDLILEESADTLIIWSGGTPMFGGDTLHGGVGNDTIYAGAGSDHLFGDSGSDTLDGGAGHDLLDGGTGSGTDTMAGGSGNDTYVVDNAGDAVTESAGQGVDVVRVSASWTMTAGADIETLETTNAAGTAAIDLTGNASGNTVRGNIGNNVINGGAGNDQLTGYAGQDSFLFNTALDAATNVDVITDFNVANDTIRLDDAIFAAFANGPLAAERFVVGTAAQDASDNIIYNSATGALLYDPDGTGITAAVQFATLTAGLALTNLDFTIV